MNIKKAFQHKCLFKFSCSPIVIKPGKTRKIETTVGVVLPQEVMVGLQDVAALA